MKRKLLMMMIGAVLTVSCDNTNSNKKENTKPSVTATTAASVAKTAKKYQAELITVPATVKANENATLTIKIKKSRGRSGQRFTDCPRKNNAFVGYF